MEFQQQDVVVITNENFSDFLPKFTEDEFKDLVDGYKDSELMPWPDKNTPLVFGSPKPSLIVFAGADSIDSYDTLISIYEKLDKLNIAFIEDVFATNNDYFKEAFSIDNESDLPAVRLCTTINGNQEIYKMTEKYRAKNLLKFVADWENGQLTPFLKSEEIPEVQGGFVYNLVGRNFNQIVLEEDKDVLVFFYSQNQRSLDFKYIYNKLAIELATESTLVLAQMDIMLNETDKVNVIDIPTVAFFPANQKENPIIYNSNFVGIREREAAERWALKTFIKSNATHPLT